MRAYKLFRQRRDGTIGPLFINARQRVPTGEWLPAGDHPTKGFAHRPGWHTVTSPRASRLSGKGRVWYEVEVKDFYPFKRPPAQGGGVWLIANWMKVVGPVSV